MKDFSQESLTLHFRLKGKLKTSSKVPINNTEDLSISYSPGVAAPCLAINKDPELAKELTIKANTVAVVSDGSAVLGLGNIGPLAAIPVMEGKAILFKEFGKIDAFPICLDTQDKDEIIETVRRIAPVFAGINLEDIEAPKAFEIEEALQDLGIPVFHDDQHGTAIVLFAALLNALKLVGKKLEELRVVINGAGAAGINIAKILKAVDYGTELCPPVKELIVCDSKGIIHSNRDDLNPYKASLLEFTNPNNLEGSLSDALKGADVFVGVSMGNVVSGDDVRKMAKDPIIFALANPIPEIEPQLAYEAGAAVVGTGRSDYPNQVNNVLAFPGIFRGAIDGKAKVISPKMRMAAALALANCVRNPRKEKILPESLSHHAAYAVAEAVKGVALSESGPQV